MLEGKEVVKKLGEYGEASVDLQSDGKLDIAVSVKVDLIAELEKLAAKTATPMDDKAVAWIKGMLAVLPK